MSAFLCSLLLSSICLISLVESINNGGITVDLIHRDSSRSPSYDSANTHFQRLRSAFDRAFSRKTSLMSVDAPVSPAGGEYLMKIKIGTPPVEQLGIADTGSDLTWTQCKPCTHCYKQNLSLFDPSKTSSYRPVSCESDQCASSGTAQCNSRNSCEYQVLYGDRSHSYGQLAVETFTFDGGVSFPKVTFGCGHKNAGTFSQTGSGIVGLGGGSISIISQLRSSIGGKFSYCLALLNSNATSKISFGRSAAVAGPKVVSTPLVKKSPDTYYYLTLEGVSVGRKRLDYRSSSTKASSAGREGNIIIDSGTTLTFLPSDLYNRVEATLKKAVKGNRVSDPQGMFKLCYRSKGGVRSPPITAHFKGADLVLTQESIFVEVEEGIICLTLVPSQDLAIFGNLHQMNYHIGYDLVKRQVNFLPTDCSKSQ
ncbi:Eukaryotic aspartyl protease family protein [Perilla frutescens var. hirtella]|uniref:Eukaryotic aspartyl protease family protein n=1 Tax=Perilla frutescens var. hirtella TaxID=608512 RepID=A0AAD4PA28_PERFH|nr:Eukaryotic aspartyl protease family protein [Perilla frutescens var. hirtella]